MKILQEERRSRFGKFSEQHKHLFGDVMLQHEPEKLKH